MNNEGSRINEKAHAERRGLNVGTVYSFGRYGAEALLPRFLSRSGLPTRICLGRGRSQGPARGRSGTVPERHTASCSGWFVGMGKSRRPRREVHCRRSHGRPPMEVLLESGGAEGARKVAGAKSAQGKVAQGVRTALNCSAVSMHSATTLILRLCRSRMAE